MAEVKPRCERSSERPWKKRFWTVSKRFLRPEFLKALDVVGLSCSMGGASGVRVYFQPGGDPGADPEHAGEILSMAGEHQGGER